MPFEIYFRSPAGSSPCWQTRRWSWRRSTSSPCPSPTTTPTTKTEKEWYGRRRRRKETGPGRRTWRTTKSPQSWPGSTSSRPWSSRGSEWGEEKKAQIHVQIAILAIFLVGICVSISFFENSYFSNISQAQELPAWRHNGEAPQAPPRRAGKQEPQDVRTHHSGPGVRVQRPVPRRPRAASRQRGAVQGNINQVLKLFFSKGLSEDYNALAIFTCGEAVRS